MRKYISTHPTLFAGWTPEDVDGFCRLVFRNGELTIGAPTSPSISNALCFELDVVLDGLSSGQSVKYTRYADDLFFSSTQKDVLYHLERAVKEQIGKLEVPSRLRLNVAKTKHSSKRGARRVTGIILGSDSKAHVARETKRYIRSMVNRVEKLDEPAITKLAGLIAYVVGLEPGFINKLILKYGPQRVDSARGRR